MHNPKEKIRCPRCGISLYDNPPKISLLLDFDKKNCIDTIYCSVCNSNLTSFPDKGRHGYSAMISCKHKGTPPWEK
jgi:hypothetical protein